MDEVGAARALGARHVLRERAPSDSCELQSKAAFVLMSKVSYPLSPLFVILNTLRSMALTALAVPPIGIRNVVPLAAMPDTSSPPGQGKGRRPASAQGSQPPTSQVPVAVLAAVRATLEMSLYVGGLVLGSAL